MGNFESNRCQPTNQEACCQVQVIGREGCAQGSWKDR